MVRFANLGMRCFFLVGGGLRGDPGVPSSPLLLVLPTE